MLPRTHHGKPRGSKITLSKIGQQDHSERLCILTSINHLIQRGVEWVKDKDHTEFFNTHFYEIS